MTDEQNNNPSTPATPSTSAPSDQPSAAAPLNDAKAGASAASDKAIPASSVITGSTAPTAEKATTPEKAARPEKPGKSPKAEKPEFSKPEKPVPVKARLGMGARFVLFLALLLAATAAAGAGYLFYWLQQQRVTYVEDQLRLNSQLSERTAQITRLQNDLQQASQQLAQDRAALVKATESRNQLQGRMAALEKDIAQVTGAHRIDWMLREAEHFVMVAERRVSLLGDAGGALALLQEADDIVRDMQEPAARPLRDALVKDMHSLKLASQTSIDYDGIFLRIEQLVKRVPALNIPRYELYQSNPGASSAEPLPQDGVPLLWRRFTDFFKSLVRFQKHDKMKPLLLSTEREYLAQGIVLLLEQSQLALLRGDNQAYRLSLLEARSRVDGYINLQTEESKVFLTELDVLAAVKLRPPVPAIDDSVRAVQVFREFWAKEKIEREQLIRKIERVPGAIAAPAPAPTPAAAPAAEAKP